MKQESIPMTSIKTVDVAVLINRCAIVLIRRAKPPFEDRLVLPGGHIDHTDVSPRHAAARELREEIGLDVRAECLAPLLVLDRRDRDPRPGHRVSEVFVLHLASINDLRGCHAASDAASLHVRELAALSECDIGFDHFTVIRALRP